MVICQFHSQPVMTISSPVHDHPSEILLEPFSCSGLLFEILLVQFSRSGLPFEIFFSRSAVITIRSTFLTSRSGPSVRNVTPAVQPFRSTVRKFSQPFRHDYHLFEIFRQPFSRHTNPFGMNYQPFGFIHFKRLRGPFLSRSTAVRFTHLMESRQCTFSHERSQFQKQVEFDRLGERSPEQDCCC